MFKIVCWVTLATVLGAFTASGQIGDVVGVEDLTAVCTNQRTGESVTSPLISDSLFDCRALSNVAGDGIQMVLNANTAHDSVACQEVEITGPSDIPTLALLEPGDCVRITGSTQMAPDGTGDVEGYIFLLPLNGMGLRFSLQGPSDVIFIHLLLGGDGVLVNCLYTPELCQTTMLGQTNIGAIASSEPAPYTIDITAVSSSDVFLGGAAGLQTAAPQSALTAYTFTRHELGERYQRVLETALVELGLKAGTTAVLSRARSHFPGRHM
ncbi:hypothetical protein [Candidatus Entotheonella palauensis]|uniref:hypothetical protein n=1 Tax=Candidatus Entotheonella palauensis TaxID=93172 RepID=UPI000B7F71E0|nr:hypothetical protein [Candidatus Entotheonella palauensis]